MKRIYVPTRSGSEWQPLLAKPQLQWKRGKSAMTTAASWEDAQNAFPREIETLLNSSHDDYLVQLQLLLAIPEWEVALEGGDTASHTDVLAIARNAEGLCVVAVEAKVDESFGPLLSEKRAEATSGQSTRIDFLQSLLGVAKFQDSIRYQLLHRTASALLTARQFHARTAVMLVQAFGSRSEQRDDFDRFCTALGASQVVPDLLVVRAHTDPRLFVGWCNGDSRFLSVELPSAP